MIPARSGSKGLPKKNIKNLLGKPIVSYSLISALKSEKINSVYLNSDSDEYLDLGKKLGAKTYKRPVELGEDNTSMKAVLSDFSKYLINKKEKFDAIVVLYPTNPLRTTKFINEFIDQFNLMEVDESYAIEESDGWYARRWNSMSEEEQVNVFGMAWSGQLRSQIVGNSWEQLDSWEKQEIKTHWDRGNESHAREDADSSIAPQIDYTEPTYDDLDDRLKGVTQADTADSLSNFGVDVTFPKYNDNSDTTNLGYLEKAIFNESQMAETIYEEYYNSIAPMFATYDTWDKYAKDSGLSQQETVEIWKKNNGEPDFRRISLFVGFNILFLIYLPKK